MLNNFKIMLFEKSIKQVQIIKQAYDKTVEDFNCGKADLDYLPDSFKNSEKFKRFINAISSCNSGDHRIKYYLNPKEGMNYLDCGSCANLISYKLYEWPSLYFGIDISHKLLTITNAFVRTNKLNIGGLFIADISNLPFTNNFFDIASAIGVLEYYEVDYINLALKELNRVIKQNGKLVIDMPNEDHPDVLTMIEYENYLGRTRNKIVSKNEFIKALNEFFIIDYIDDSEVMMKYFLWRFK